MEFTKVNHVLYMTSLEVEGILVEVICNHSENCASPTYNQIFNALKRLLTFDISFVITAFCLLTR